ncbi:hypothetical protein HML84_02020 [Alcanivorax sp. IO_7]|nr:hypothetical protein HML84_02020 [Alcanivorax sp. IO_7]
MQQRTRQRLIGLLLLLLLAAIVAPLVLRSPEQVRVALDMSIPEPPAMDEPEVAPVIGEREQVATDEQISDEQRAVAEAGERALDEAPDTGETPSREPRPDPSPPPRRSPLPSRRRSRAVRTRLVRASPCRSPVSATPPTPRPWSPVCATPATTPTTAP